MITKQNLDTRSSIGESQGSLVSEKLIKTGHLKSPNK